jgi:hypothetical protein
VVLAAIAALGRKLLKYQKTTVVSAPLIRRFPDVFLYGHLPAWRGMALMEPQFGVSTFLATR